MNYFDLKFPIIKLCYLVFILSIQSCSSTNLGSKLSDSFSEPVPSFDSSKVPINMKGINKQSVKKTLDNIKGNTITEKNVDKIKTNLNITNPKKIYSRERNIGKKSSFSPQTYRIILKLSDVNPSAPAEIFTSTLRDAGIKFEVEKIELYKNNKLNR